MSTKTTFKRVALVAVAALGLGVLTSVAPANAAGRTASSIVVGTIPPARVGVSSYVPVTVYLATAAAGDSVTVNAQISAAPISGGVANAASLLFKGTAGTENNVSTNTPALLGFVADEAGTVLVTGTAAGQAAQTSGYIVSGVAAASAAAGTTNAASSVAYYLTAADVAAKSFTLAVKITPDVAGTYSVLVSTAAVGTTTKGYTAGDPSALFSIAPGAGPATVTTTTVAGGTILAGSPVGALVKVSLKDAAGNASSLSGNEVINVTTSGSGAVAKGSTNSGYTTTTVTLGATDFTNGVAYVQLRHTGTAAQTISLVLTGSGTLSPTVTSTTTYAVTGQAAGADAAKSTLTWDAPSTTSLYSMTAATTPTTDNLAVTPLSTSQTWGFTPAAALAAGADTQYGYVTVTDTDGKITGVPLAKYDLRFSLAAEAKGSSFTIPAAFNGAGAYSFTFATPGTSFLGITTNGTKTVTATARTNTKFTFTPTSSILAAPAAAIALTATLEDQYGAAVASQTVTITTTGRNNPVATTAVTDATGKVTFTTADASTSLTALTDTVTFASSVGTASNAVTINYGNTAVGTVTVTGGNTTDSVNALTNDVKGISVGSSTAGVEAGAINITATVKDALGNALAGVPVSFAVTGTTAAFTTTTATVYSGSTGTAVGKLYAWANGTYTYTITAGGKTTTGTATFGSIAAGNARVISATVAGNVVTGKAVDRLGNTVANVPLWAVATGGANIGGAFVATANTGADGTRSWVVTGGGEVTITAVDPTLPAGTTAHQTCALAGNRTCATATTAAAAYAATVAGTATTAEKHVGATFAPAGVASAKVTVEAPADTAQAAADAAAEATDAANAATDAANAAAEAADAATAAAQDAADAVAALSTQVSEMVNALKKQITALTNLVIKIQKKVRA
jgi:trimeric autotransporter adhesin